jgi:hypothetical protein
MRNVLATAAAAILVIGMTTAHALPRRGLPTADVQEPSPLPWEAPSAQFNGWGPRLAGSSGFDESGSVSGQQVEAGVAAACVQDPDCSEALSAYCETCDDGSTACAHFECASDQCLVVVCPQ